MAERRKTKASNAAVMTTTFELAKKIVAIDRDRLNMIAAAQEDPKTEQQQRELLATGQKIEALNNALHWMEVYEGIGA